MKYMGDSHWWNEKFKLRELNIMKHEKCLEEDIKYFPKEGRVLDVACGDGRNLLYLARLGYKVHAIDFSEEALNRLNYFAEKEKLYIETKLVDLSSEDVFINLDKYEVIIINHYRLNPNLYDNLISCLNIGGVLWVNGFREVPSDNPNITVSDILSEDDFAILNSYKQGNKQLYELGKRKFIKYVWRKE